MTESQAALHAVHLYQHERGVIQEEIKHVPLHYHMADLVTGLMKLAEAKGLDWKAIVKDAKEGVQTK